MRLAIMVAALGLVMGAPVVAPTALMNKAEAQAATGAISAEERSLEAQITALAQAGNTAGLQAFINVQVNAGRAGMLARIARRVAASGQSLAGTDTATAARLANAAILIASNSSVAAADTTVEADVGGTAAQTAATLSALDPASSASIQQTAAAAGSSNLVASFMTGGSNTQTATVGGEQGGNQQTGAIITTGTTTTRTVQTPVVTPITTDTITVPVVPEPNPGQSGGSPT